MIVWKMLLKWLQGRVWNLLEGLLINNDEFCNKPITTLWAHRRQQCEQCWSSLGREELSSWCDKPADSLSLQWNESFSPQPSKKQSPGNMHNRNHTIRMPIKLLFKKTTFPMYPLVIKFSQDDVFLQYNWYFLVKQRKTNLNFCWSEYHLSSCKQSIKSAKKCCRYLLTIPKPGWRLRKTNSTQTIISGYNSSQTSLCQTIFPLNQGVICLCR